MDSHKIGVAMEAGDGSWRVAWADMTATAPNRAAAMARDLVSVAASAAQGAWPGENVKAHVERIHREYPELAAPGYSEAATDLVVVDATSVELASDVSDAPVEDAVFLEPNNADGSDDAADPESDPALTTESTLTEGGQDGQSSSV